MIHITDEQYKKIRDLAEWVYDGEHHDYYDQLTGGEDVEGHPFQLAVEILGIAYKPGDLLGIKDSETHARIEPKPISHVVYSDAYGLITVVFQDSTFVETTLENIFQPERRKKTKGNGS